MEAQDPEQKQGQSQPRPQLDPSKGLEQALTLLKAKDDTSRFVGLALLKSILDNNVELQKDSKTIAECWAAIPTRFLDRLLRAGESGKKSKEEAKSMVELAVAVIHAFVVLLPKQLQEDGRLLGRTEGLMSALTKSSSDTTQILQVLLTFASTQQGAFALLQVEDWSPMLEIATQESLVLDIVKYTFINVASKNVEESRVSRKLSAAISALILAFRDAPGSGRLLDCLCAIFTGVPTEVTPRNCKKIFVMAADGAKQVVVSSPVWLEPLTKLIYQAFNKSQPGKAAANRQGAILLSAALLHLHPAQYPPLLFNGPTPRQTGPDSKPSSYLFVKLLLIDIRTTIPSLQEILNSPEYPQVSARLAASYDLVSAFIGFLVSILDDEDDDNDTKGDSTVSSSEKPTTTSILPPDLLLQLRVDIAETISLTIEHLRDRYDASVAGAAGLHPSARPSTTTTTSPAETAPTGTPLAISWDSATTSMPHDPLTLSQLRTLALWLREDDNDRLRAEAAGIADVLLGLYSTRDGPHDFRSPVLIALEGITATAEGVEAFLAAEGWEILLSDLRDVLASGEDASRGIEIVRVLLGVAESDVSGPTCEEWMEVVKLAPSPARCGGQVKELRIAVWQLSVELLVRAPAGMRRRYAGQARRIVEAARSLLHEEAGGEVDLDLGLDEVLQGLEALGFR